MWLDESLGVSGLHHLQPASLYRGRSKVQKDAFEAGRLLNSQRCWACLGTTWRHRKPRAYAIPQWPSIIYKGKLGLQPLRGKQFCGSQEP